eukprot:4743693-Pyramimonas_sp.AAC.1
MEETESYDPTKWRKKVVQSRDVFVPRPQSASAVIDLKLGLEPTEIPKALDPLFESRIQAQILAVTQMTEMESDLSDQIGSIGIAE